MQNINKDKKVQKLRLDCAMAIVFACQDENLKISEEKILEKAQIRLEQKKICKKKEKCRKLLGIQSKRPLEYALEYAKLLLFNEEETQLVRELTDQLNILEISDGENPQTIAGGLIYLAAQLSRREEIRSKDLMQIRKVVGRTEGTIRNFYAKLSLKKAQICSNLLAKGVYLYSVGAATQKMK